MSCNSLRVASMLSFVKKQDAIKKPLVGFCDILWFVEMVQTLMHFLNASKQPFYLTLGS